MVNSVRPVVVLNSIINGLSNIIFLRFGEKITFLISEKYYIGEKKWLDKHFATEFWSIFQSMKMATGQLHP